MLGRAAYHTPWVLARVDSLVFGGSDPVSGRFDALDAYRPYLERRMSEGVPLHAMTRHILGLFHGQPGGRHWRRILSEKGGRQGSSLDVLDEARAAVAQQMDEAA
jgi:tRNA-dihydrouridine synthase A